jgi:hypothetical protein
MPVRRDPPGAMTRAAKRRGAGLSAAGRQAGGHAVHHVRGRQPWREHAAGRASGWPKKAKPNTPDSRPLVSGTVPSHSRPVAAQNAQAETAGDVAQVADWIRAQAAA